jgi:hypothetical protein
VFACLKTMSNLKLYDGQITVKADKQTQACLNDWVESKRHEWIAKQDKERPSSLPDKEELLSREKAGEVMPYERQLIPHLEEIKLEFKEALDDHMGPQGYDFNELMFISGAPKDVRPPKDAPKTELI